MASMPYNQMAPYQTPAQNKLTKKGITAGGTLGPGASNNRDQKQGEIEKYLLNQLGDRFKHAKLLEVSEGSYLITMDVRLPVFGKSMGLA